jgi:RimJ/RimL family protein N-acetyltransferase
VRALVAHGFDADGFAYLRAGHFTDNPASQNILRKVGFTADGEEMRDCAARGEPVRCFTYRLDRADALANLRWP